MFLPLSLGALIVVILVSPIYWAAEHPYLAVAGLWSAFVCYAQFAQWRARRKLAWNIAKKAESREEQKRIFREVLNEERRHRAF